MDPSVRAVTAEVRAIVRPVPFAMPYPLWQAPVLTTRLPESTTLAHHSVVASPQCRRLQESTGHPDKLSNASCHLTSTEPCRRTNSISVRSVKRQLGLESIAIAMTTTLADRTTHPQNRGETEKLGEQGEQG